MIDDAFMLPSWRPGPTRDAVIGFLRAAPQIPPRDRVACFDNDGTLWCERPGYAQLDFFVDALLGLFDGATPEEFTAQARDYLARAEHPTLGRPVRATTYQPMLELVDALRDLDFTVCIVTGGGTEFVRAVSEDLYGVPPEAVVGSLVSYAYGVEDGDPVLRRTTALDGVANEGAAKVSHIQSHLGRRPVMAAGNSGGDREMLEWAAAGEGPTLAILVDHDDAEREFAYVSSAETVAEPEPITDVAARAGWTVASMARDWEVVFGSWD